MSKNNKIKHAVRKIAVSFGAKQIVWFPSEDGSFNGAKLRIPNEFPQIVSYNGISFSSRATNDRKNEWKYCGTLEELLA